MKWNIIRKQLTPPGTDRVLVEFDEATEEEVREQLVFLATQELENDKGATSLSYNPKEYPIRATTIGQPFRTGNKYSPHSSLACFEAVQA